MSRSAWFPSAISQIQVSPTLGRTSAEVPAWATSRTRRAMRPSASSCSAPDSRRVVISWDRAIHCSRSRAWRYRRAFSTAIAAASASVTTASISVRPKPPGRSPR